MRMTCMKNPITNKTDLTITKPTCPSSSRKWGQCALRKLLVKKSSLAINSNPRTRLAMENILPYKYGEEIEYDVKCQTLESSSEFSIVILVAVVSVLRSSRVVCCFFCRSFCSGCVLHVVEGYGSWW